MMAAFTSVSTRRGFGSSSTYTQAPSTPPTEGKKSTVFPPGVRAYVQRCFASEHAIAGVTTEEMQTRLKAVINDVAGRGALDTTNWDMLPLPQEMIMTDRNIGPVKPNPQQGTALNTSNTAFSPTNQDNPKKRKSSDVFGQDEMMNDRAPPWRKVKTENVLENRLTYPTPTQAQNVNSSQTDKKQRKAKKNGINTEMSKLAVNDLEKRRQRFGLGSLGEVSLVRMPSPSQDSVQGPVIGTCEVLEKRYFRLTSAPKPEIVRPLPVLEKTLDLLKKKWKTNYNYSYICDQFKSMRQDLTVQHIKNAFTVNVYETHAHIALQQGDLGEYNQCQTQLRALYKLRLGGRPAEFLAYRILYFIYTGSRTDMSNLLASVTAADRQVPAVKHALDVRSALALGNYHRFFRLYLEAPNMGPYLMDMFILRERLHAMANISRSYKPDVPLRFLTEELAFEDDRECAGFICHHGGDALLESKSEGPVFQSSKAGAIFEAARAAAFRRVDLKGQI